MSQLLDLWGFILIAALIYIAITRSILYPLCSFVIAAYSTKISDYFNIHPNEPISVILPLLILNLFTLGCFTLPTRKEKKKQQIKQNTP